MGIVPDPFNEPVFPDIPREDISEEDDDDEEEYEDFDQPDEDDDDDIPFGF